MPEKRNPYVRYTLVLGLIALVCSLGVAVVYSVTREAIRRNEAKVFQEAMRNVVPEATRFAPVGAEGDAARVIKALDDTNAVRGYISESRVTGYGGQLAVMVGVRADLDEIAGIQVLSHSETPGLGARLDEVKTDVTLWSKLAGMFGGCAKKAPPGKKAFQEQFRGLTFNQLRVVKSTDEKGVVALTAATITTEAVTKAVEEGVNTIRRIVGEPKP